MVIRMTCTVTTQVSNVLLSLLFYPILLFLLFLIFKLFYFCHCTHLSFQSTRLWRRFLPNILLRHGTSFHLLLSCSIFLLLCFSIFPTHFFSPSNFFPLSRYGHTATLLTTEKAKSMMVVFGGYDSNGFLCDDLYTIDLGISLLLSSFIVLFLFFFFFC